MTQQTATIDVYQDDPQYAGLRWFQFPERLHIASYLTEPWDADEFGEAVPHPESVREARRLHPGALLVFLEPGGGVKFPADEVSIN